MRHFLFSLLIIFIVNVTNAQISDSSTRMVKLEGAINFRDIGGYKTSSGKIVKSGILYRSADLSKLTENDLKKIESIKIKYDFDFRGPYEVKSAPDKIPADVIRIALPAGSETVGDSTYMKEMSKRLKDESFILSFYNNISPFGDRYKPVFDSLLSFKANQALVFHCTAGKDRTGIAAALILYALGVDEETIINDYEATNYYRKDENAKTINQMKRFYGMDDKTATSLMAAKREYIQSTFDTIKSQYGTIDQYLEKVMDLNGKKIRLLRKYYTR